MSHCARLRQEFIRLVLQILKVLWTLVAISVWGSADISYGGQHAMGPPSWQSLGRRRVQNLGKTMQSASTNNLVAKMKNKSLSSMPLKRLSPKSSRSLNFSASSLSEAWSREGVSFPWIWLSKLNSQRTWLSSMLHCSSSSCQLKPFPIESIVPDVSLLLFFPRVFAKLQLVFLKFPNASQLPSSSGQCAWVLQPKSSWPRSINRN